MTQAPLDLTVQTREIFGKKLNTLRKQGILPGNIYGKKIESEAIQVNTKQFMHLYNQAGETRVINLVVEGSSKKHPVLVTGIQLDPINDIPLHVDFRQVNLKEKINATVPLELVGESPAVDAGGIIVQQVSEIEVEALPTELPEQINVDISLLKEIDDVIYLKDLPIDTERVSIESDPETIIVKVEAPMTEEEASDAIIDPDSVEITGEKPAEESQPSENTEE